MQDKYVSLDHGFFVNRSLDIELPPFAKWMVAAVYRSDASPRRQIIQSSITYSTDKPPRWSYLVTLNLKIRKTEVFIYVKVYRQYST